MTGRRGDDVYSLASPAVSAPARTLRYPTALFVAGAALLARIPLEAWIGEASFAPFACLAISVSAWVGGWGPGALTAAIFLLAQLLPGIVSGVARPAASPYAGAGLVFLVGLILSSMMDRARRSERELRTTVAASQPELRDLRESDRQLRTEKAYLEQMLAARDRLRRKREAAWLYDRRRRREAELLAQLSQHLHQTLDVNRMLHPIAAAAREATSADAIWLAFREAGGFRVRYLVGDQGSRPGSDEVGYESGPVGFVATIGRMFRTDNLRLDPRISSKPEELGFPADAGPVMVAPVQMGTTVEAVVVALRHAEPGFGPQDEDVLHQIAQITGVAIRNAQLLAGEQSARAAAEASSRAKDEFLAMLSHELRNPLAAVASAVAGFERMGQQWGQFQQILGRQTRHLARLLDDLLDVSRLTAGKISLHRRPIDLHSVAECVIQGLRHEGRLAHHALEFTGGPAWVSADSTRLEQVVRNLLDNALKYTPPGGRISIRVAGEADGAVLSVKDTGTGIEPDILPYVFDLFVQQPRPLDRSQGGLGLGLTVVRRLVELHGGRVAAFSGGRGHGSEFIVRFPTVPALEPPGGDTASPPPRAPRPGCCRVVVIEDYADAREALAALLRFDGHEVETATDGRAGLELLLASRPDVAFIDIGLPGVDGYEVARRTREAPGGSSLYLVALTGYGQPFDRARALDTGFDDHLVKPLDPDALHRVLHAPRRRRKMPDAPAPEGGR